MFKGWSPGDVLAFWGLTTTVAAAILAGVWHALHTARRLGRFEGEHDQMKTDIGDLQAESEKHTALGTSLQLLTQTVSMVQTTITEMRSETREGRQEMRDAVNDLKQDTAAAIGEVRHDLRNLMTGKVQPARRSARG